MVRFKIGETLFTFLSTTFCLIVVLSNIISAKLVPLPFGEGICIPAGLITYPLTFLLSDLVTEIYGLRQARLMVYMALGMNLLAFGVLQLATMVPATETAVQQKFHSVLGVSGLRIFASVTAYVISQMIDIQIYSLVKRWTGLKWLWMRVNSSTGISQLVDTCLVDLIFLFWGLGMSLNKVMPIILLSFMYKMAFSLACTPLFYGSIALIRRLKTT